MPLGSLAHFEVVNIPALLAMFPLAGLFLGGMLGVFWIGLLQIFGTQLSAALLVAAWALLTRGLHLDGLSDCADGIGGAYTAQRRLEIMKDPHVGVFGTVAIVCTLLLKYSLLSALTFRTFESGGPLEMYFPSGVVESCVDAGRHFHCGAAESVDRRVRFALCESRGIGKSFYRRCKSVGAAFWSSRVCGGRVCVEWHCRAIANGGGGNYGSSLANLFQRQTRRTNWRHHGREHRVERNCGNAGNRRE